MIGLALVLLGAGLWALVAWRRRHALPQTRWFWWLGLACGPAAVVAMECGWIVTEVGRQPWVVYRLLTTSQAATTNQGVIASLSAVIVLYAESSASRRFSSFERCARRWWRESEDDEIEVDSALRAP